MSFKIKTCVVVVEEKSRVQGCYATAAVDTSGKPVYEEVTQNLGWFVTFEGSHESLYVGDSHPLNERGEKVQAGDAAEIIVRFP